MATQQITHGELKDGDLNWRAGCLFRVTNLRRISAENQPDLKEDVIRFDGVIVPYGLQQIGRDLQGTVYDGGTYGAYVSVPTTIETRS